MNKSTYFYGKSNISQVLNFIPNTLVNRTAKQHHSHRYYKKFTTHYQLVAKYKKRHIYS